MKTRSVLVSHSNNLPVNLTKFNKKYEKFFSGCFRSTHFKEYTLPPPIFYKQQSHYPNITLFFKI